MYFFSLSFYLMKSKQDLNVFCISIMNFSHVLFDDEYLILVSSATEYVNEENNILKYYFSRQFMYVLLIIFMH